MNFIGDRYLGNLNELCGVTVVLCFFVFAGLGIWVLMSIDDFEEPSPFIKKVLKGSDYLKDNKDANKIPDKCIKALDKYLDDALTEDKDKE